MTKEKLEAKIAELEKALPQMQANFNAAMGALQAYKNILAEWDEEPKP